MWGDSSHQNEAVLAMPTHRAASLEHLAVEVCKVPSAQQELPVPLSNGRGMPTIPLISDAPPFNLAPHKLLFRIIICAATVIPSTPFFSRHLAALGVT